MQAVSIDTVANAYQRIAMLSGELERTGLPQQEFFRNVQSTWRLGYAAQLVLVGMPRSCMSEPTIRGIPAEGFGKRTRTVSHVIRLTTAAEPFACQNGAATRAAPPPQRFTGGRSVQTPS